MIFEFEIEIGSKQ